MKEKMASFVASFGLPRLIITGFLLALFILAPIVGVDLPMQITNVINRFSWNAILVLAMVPMVHSGCGLNFGLPLGIISGLLGATLSIECGFTGAMSFVMAVAISTPFAIVLGLGYGWLLNKIKGALFFRTVFFFPYVSSMVAICVCWSFMLMKDGPVNQIIMALGINYNKGWTADSTMAIWSIILVSVWRNMGYYMVLYLAALQGIPRELMEAATVDGAGKWKQFLHVTLPQLKPTTFFVSVMMVISCFKIYDVVAIMTDGGPGRSTKMLVTYIYDEAFVKIRYGQASAISMVLLVIVLAVTIIQFSSEKKFSND